MSKPKLGVSPRDLSDAALKRELRHLWRTREETIVTGSSHAIATHTRRMLELEDELIARFPDETEPVPARTRRGSRAQSRQPAGRRRSDR
ncbi:MAG: DUF6158 family protein [Actinomycetota bacterium]